MALRIAMYFIGWVDVGFILSVCKKECGPEYGQ